MQLYTSPLSPFSARVRAALYFKRLPFVNLGVPEQGLKSPEFLAINPMGRIPVLLLEGGDAIAESETILAYVEDAFPHPAVFRPLDRGAMGCVLRRDPQPGRQERGPNLAKTDQTDAGHGGAPDELWAKGGREEAAQYRGLDAVVDQDPPVDDPFHDGEFHGIAAPPPRAAMARRQRSGLGPRWMDRARPCRVHTPGSLAP